MKQVFYALAFLLCSVGTAAAGCSTSTTLTTKDAGGTTQNAACTNDANSNAVLPTTQQAIVGGTTANLISCNKTAMYDTTTSGSTQLVGLVSGQTIYVCGYTIGVGGTQTNVGLTYGTGTACATGTTKITPNWQIPAFGEAGELSYFYTGIATAVSNELCINTSAGNAVQALVHYTQF